MNKQTNISWRLLWISSSCCSGTKQWLTLCDPMDCTCQNSLFFTISMSSLKLMCTESVMPSNHLILCPSLLSPTIFPSIRGFFNESTLPSRWRRYQSFSFRISPNNEYSGLISFRIDWFDLLAVQGTPKSFLQHHSSKASLLRCSAFYMAQLSHPYMTTWKTTALTIQNCISKVISLLFSMLFRFFMVFPGVSDGKESATPMFLLGESPWAEEPGGLQSMGYRELDITEQLSPHRFVIAFLSRRKLLSISWWQSPSTVILECKNIRSVTARIMWC